MADSVRPKELWLGEYEEKPGTRRIVPGGAKETVEEVATELDRELGIANNPSFHCYVERRRCADCKFLKDGPIIGPIRKVPGAARTWCDYWACYGAEPEGFCFRYDEEK